MKKLKSLSTITIAICIATACFTSCKKKPIELTGKSEQFIGIWECVWGYPPTSSAPQAPEDGNFIHDIEIKQNGEYILYREDDFEEKGVIINMEEIKSGYEFSFKPCKKGKENYYKSEVYRLHTFNNELFINGGSQYDYTYRKK